ncbi:FtsK/SpoIIIE domain-containing protein [Nocardia sp. NPDC050713]|uniref:FtsK/SpoIIIE domain-containing protein n=1 Tax=Nocardia sp. NPDC050713 TaxID=3154511 RepID=UPI0033C16EB7
MGNGELMAIGAIGGAGVLVFGGIVAYTTAENMGSPGWTGPVGMVFALGSVGGVVVANKVGRNRRERREIERAFAERMAFLAAYPEELRFALDTLSDDFQARLVWTHPQIGVGLPENPHMLFPGTWPRLLPGQDPGYPPDNGVRPSPVGARIRLEMPPGFSADHIRHRLPGLASSLRVPRVQVAAAKGDHVVTIELRVRNPLAATVRYPGPEASPVPLKALRVAMREDGEFYRLRLWNNHLFLAGVTGSGKSGVLWSIIGALAPDIATGRVQLHVIDLKRGGEMAAGYRLYASWAYLVADAIAVLEKLLRIMRERLDVRREHAMRTGEPIRNHEAEVGDPHHVLLIDEIIALVELVGDIKAEFDVPQIDGTYKRETIRVDKYIGRLLMELLSQSRAVGFTLIAATQNAAKAIFDLLKDLFPVTIGLRQASAQQVQMVYGTGAAERGIDATAITVDEAGVGFIDSPEAGGMAQRIRFFRVDDTDIMRLVEIFGRSADAPLPVLTTLLPDDAAEESASSAAGNVVTLHRTGSGEAGHVEGGAAPTHCLYSKCGVELEQVPGGRPKLYCSPTHRAYAKRERDKQQGNQRQA